MYDPAAEDIEDQEEDEYEPTPAKPVVRGRGRGATAAAKAASMRQPVAKPAARDRKGRVRRFSVILDTMSDTRVVYFDPEEVHPLQTYP